MVPTKELVLAGKDAAADYDELAEPQDFQDDPEWGQAPHTHACINTCTHILRTHARTLSGHMEWRHVYTHAQTHTYSKCYCWLNASTLVSLSPFSTQCGRLQEIQQDWLLHQSGPPEGGARRCPWCPSRSDTTSATWPPPSGPTTRRPRPPPRPSGSHTTWSSAWDPWFSERPPHEDRPQTTSSFHPPQCSFQFKYWNWGRGEGRSSWKRKSVHTAYCFHS